MNKTELENIIELWLEDSNFYDIAHWPEFQEWLIMDEDVTITDPLYCFDLKCDICGFECVTLAKRCETEYECSECGKMSLRQVEDSED